MRNPNGIFVVQLSFEKLDFLRIADQKSWILKSINQFVVNLNLWSTLLFLRFEKLKIIRLMSYEAL